MRKSCNLHKTLAFATVVAARGTCVGATMAQARAQQGNFGAVQDKTAPLRDAGSQKSKFGARRYKPQTPEDGPGGMQPITPAHAGMTIGGRNRARAAQYKGSGGGLKGGLVPAVKQ